MLYNLRRWQYKAKYIASKDNARIISEFCKDIEKYKNAVKKWKKLAKKLKKNNYDDDLDEIYDRLRNLMGMNKLKKPILHNARKTVMDNITQDLEKALHECHWTEAFFVAQILQRQTERNRVYQLLILITVVIGGFVHLTIA